MYCSVTRRTTNNFNLHVYSPYLQYILTYTKHVIDYRTHICVGRIECVLDGAENEFGERIDEQAKRVATHSRVVHELLYVALRLLLCGCLEGHRNGGLVGGIRLSPVPMPSLCLCASIARSSSAILAARVRVRRAEPPRGAGRVAGRVRFGRSGGHRRFEANARANQIGPQVRTVQELPAAHQLARLLIEYSIYHKSTIRVESRVFPAYFYYIG